MAYKTSLPKNRKNAIIYFLALC